MQVVLFLIGGRNGVTEGAVLGRAVEEARTAPLLWELLSQAEGSAVTGPGGAWRVCPESNGLGSVAGVERARSG